MVRLAAVVAALLGLILRHVACPEWVAASSLPRRHPGLPRVDGAHCSRVVGGAAARVLLLQLLQRSGRYLYVCVRLRG